MLTFECKKKIQCERKENWGKKKRKEEKIKSSVQKTRIEKMFEFENLLIIANIAKFWFVCGKTPVSGCNSQKLESDHSITNGTTNESE